MTRTYIPCKAVSLFYLFSISQHWAYFCLYLPMQGEECSRNPLQRASLPTHCTSPHDWIVTMHPSPVQDLYIMITWAVYTKYVTIIQLQTLILQCKIEYNKTDSLCSWICWGPFALEELPSFFWNICQKLEIKCGCVFITASRSLPFIHSCIHLCTFQVITRVSWTTYWSYCS